MEEFNNLVEPFFIKLIAIHYKMSEAIPLSETDEKHVNCLKMMLPLYYKALNDETENEKQSDVIDDVINDAINVVIDDTTDDIELAKINEQNKIKFNESIEVSLEELRNIQDTFWSTIDLDDIIGDDIIGDGVDLR